MPTTPCRTPEPAETFAQALARQQLRAASAKSRAQSHRDARRDGLSPAVVDTLFATPREVARS